MSEYDNTNKGAAFAPFDRQRLILQGKLNHAGNDHEIVLVQDETKTGKKIIKVYAKVAVLFPNKSDNENAPHYTGPVELSFASPEKRLAAWKRSSEAGNKFISMSLGEAQIGDGTKTSISNTLDDDIPF